VGTCRGHQGHTSVLSLGVTHGLLLARLARLPGARRSLACRFEHRPLDRCDSLLEAGRASPGEAGRDQPTHSCAQHPQALRDLPSTPSAASPLGRCSRATLTASLTSSTLHSNITPNTFTSQPTHTPPSQQATSLLHTIDHNCSHSRNHSPSPLPRA
jgi:hypothetical protein